MVTPEAEPAEVLLPLVELPELPVSLLTSA